MHVQVVVFTAIGHRRRMFGLLRRNEGTACATDSLRHFASKAPRRFCVLRHSPWGEAFRRRLLRRVAIEEQIFLPALVAKLGHAPLYRGALTHDHEKERGTALCVVTGSGPALPATSFPHLRRVGAEPPTVAAQLAIVVAAPGPCGSVALHRDVVFAACRNRGNVREARDRRRRRTVGRSTVAQLARRPGRRPFAAGSVRAGSADLESDHWPVSCAASSPTSGLACAGNRRCHR